MAYKNDLYHYGIKGQKWYIRRFQNKDGTLTEAGKKRRGERDDIRGDLAGLSDEELKKAITRLADEEAFVTKMQSLMTKTTKPKVFSKILADIGQKTMQNIGGQLSVYLVGETINKIAKKLGAEDNIVNPKKGQKDK